MVPDDLVVGRMGGHNVVNHVANFIAGCFLASKTLAPVMLAVAVMVDDGWLKLKNTIREF